MIPPDRLGCIFAQSRSVAHQLRFIIKIIKDLKRIKKVKSHELELQEVAHHSQEPSEEASVEHEG